MEFKLPKDSPRYQAGAFTVEGGTGPITGMQTCGDFLEIYKKDKTFRVQTPESIDPEQTDPNAPWVITPVADVGSSNPIVSRVFIQGCELVSSAMLDAAIDKDALKKEFHSIKEQLLVSERAFGKLTGIVAEITAWCNSEGINIEKGRALNPFPHVPELNEISASFLIHAKRALNHVGRIPSHFYDISSRGSNFDKLGRQLEQKCEKGSGLVKFVLSNAGNVKRIIDLRNYQEHPDDKKATIIENYSLPPGAKNILEPGWYLTGEDRRFITQEMQDIIGCVIWLAEHMTLHVLDHNISKKFPQVISRVKEDEVDENCPVLYRLSIDHTRLTFNK